MKVFKKVRSLASRLISWLVNKLADYSFGGYGSEGVGRLMSQSGSESPT